MEGPVFRRRARQIILRSGSTSARPPCIRVACSGLPPQLFVPAANIDAGSLLNAGLWKSSKRWLSIARSGTPIQRGPLPYVVADIQDFGENCRRDRARPIPVR